MILQYPGLTPREGQTLLGQPLGCTSDGLPLQVIGATAGPADGVLIEVEEWDPPAFGDVDLAYPAAAQYAWHVSRGQHLPPTAGPDPDRP